MSATTVAVPLAESLDATESPLVLVTVATTESAPAGVPTAAYPCMVMILLTPAARLPIVQSAVVLEVIVHAAPPVIAGAVVET